jgi:hypothetical protein
VTARKRAARPVVYEVPEEFSDANPHGFKNFLFLVWQHLGLPDPTPVQYDIADWMQHGPRRQITEAFRGVGKSFIAAAYVCWKLLNNAQLKFMVVSASSGRADAFSIFVKRLIEEMPILMHLRPRDDQRDSNLAFDVGPATNDQSPSVKSVGITGQLTGSRADEIIADDVESLNNSATNDQRMKLGERIKEFDAVLKPDGKVKYLGTPQTEFSIYNELGQRGYETRIWPARFPDDALRAKYGKALAPFITEMLTAGARIGATTEPLRFTDIDLVEREASYGRSGFALQFMLDTSLSDADRYPLKLADLIVMGVGDMAPAKVVWGSAPDQIAKELPNIGLKGDHLYRPMDTLKPWGEFTGCVMAIDPSGRGKDETGYAIVKIRNGQIYLVASGGFQDGYSPATLDALAALALRFKVNEVLVEDNFGNGMFTALLRPVMAKKHPVTCTETHSLGQKELRIIDTLEPVLNQHRLIVDEKVLRDDVGGADADGNLVRDQHKTLQWQLTRLTRDRGALRHDDRVEALAMAVAYWTEAMNRDVDRAMEESRAALLDAELEDFMGNIVLQGDQESTWASQQRSSWFN